MRVGTESVGNGENGGVEVRDERVCCKPALGRAPFAYDKGPAVEVEYNGLLFRSWAELIRS